MIWSEISFATYIPLYYRLRAAKVYPGSREMYLYMPDVFMGETGQLLDQRFWALNKVPAVTGIKSNRYKIPWVLLAQQSDP